MNALKSTKIIVVAMLFLAACGNGDTSQNADAAFAADDADVSFVCDPKGANPEMGDLLNTALDKGVEVIEKTPQHPGNPGPLELP